MDKISPPSFRPLMSSLQSLTLRLAVLSLSVSPSLPLSYFSVLVFAFVAVVAVQHTTATTYRVMPRSLTTSMSAEWSPKDGSQWQESDYEAELKKLEKEAEDRLEAKIEEMMAKIETTGTK